MPTSNKAVQIKKPQQSTRRRALPDIRPVRLRRQAAQESKTFQTFEADVHKALPQPLVPLQTREKERKETARMVKDVTDVPPPTLVDEAPLIANLPHMGILEFEPQLQRINTVLNHWLQECHFARFENVEGKYRSIAAMTKSLHENLRMVVDVVRLLHEIYDTRTFNRLVLDAIKEIAPEVRLKIVQKLQIARQELKQMKGVTLEDFQ